MHWKEACKKKRLSTDSLAIKIKELKASSKTIATLNGSFDLMHAGHLEIIYQASMQADVLIALLNTDASIRRYKGEARPIISLEDRCQMMSALSFVDYVISFDEDDPRNMLSMIEPDVHVNGSEYGENCIEAGVVKKGGGKVHVVSLVDGLSTSNIIEKIKGICV